jgi:hypothetical protein
MISQLHCVDGQFDDHVAFHFTATGGVNELLAGLRNDGKAVVIQPVDQGTNRYVVLILTYRRIVERAH